MKRKSVKSVSELIAILFSSIILIPVYMLVNNSFKDKAGAAELNMSLPVHWRIWENYSELMKEGHILNAFKNSMFITCISVAGIVLFAAMAAFVIQRKSTRWSEMIYLIILMGLIIPPSIVPTILIAKSLHLTSSFLAIILVSVSINFSIGVFLYFGFYKTIPREIDESAWMDGCGAYRLFFSIIFPLLLPVTITVIIINFVAVWNDFQTSLYFLNSPKKHTLILTAFYFSGQKASDWNLVFADVVLVSLPVVMMYLMLQKYIISGMTAGAVKS